jgi:hypothetical protein
MPFYTLALKNQKFEDKVCHITENTGTKNRNAIGSLGASTTKHRRPQGVAAEEHGASTRTPLSGVDPSPLDTSKPPGTNHLVGARCRAPAARKKGLRSGGCRNAAMPAEDRGGKMAIHVVELVEEEPWKKLKPVKE